MATLVLGAVGTALGGSIGGSLLGLSGAALGGMIGSTAGSMLDSWIIAGLQPGQRYEGARLDSQRLTSSTEGMVIPRVYGAARLGGNLIWATDFREEVTTTEQGGKGGGGGVTSTEYSYTASFAIALCEGPIAGIGRIWVDGDRMDLTGITWRWHPGSETQGQDPTILAAMGPDATPAYRGRFIFAPLAGALSGVLSSGFGGEMFRGLFGGAGAAVAATVSHAGGMAGAGPLRSVDAAAFLRAPRLHAGTPPGLRADEVATILQRGERVLSRRETRAYERARFAAAPVVNIQVRDAESFRASRTQVAADIARAVALGRRGL